MESMETKLYSGTGPVEQTRKDKERQDKVTAEKLLIVLQIRLRQLPVHPIDQLQVV